MMPLIVSSGGFFGEPGLAAVGAFRKLGIRHILYKPHNAELLLLALGKVVQQSATS